MKTHVLNFLYDYKAKAKQNWQRTPWWGKAATIGFVIAITPVVVAEHSQWSYGIIEGITNKDLTVAQSGRCRIDNPRATVKAGGTVLRFGSVNVPGKGVQDHVWGYDAHGQVVDLVCPDSKPLCRETRKNVFAELKVQEGKAVVVNGMNDPRTATYLDRINGILTGQKLARSI